MREIVFYRQENGRCPVEEFLDSLSDKQVEKVLWVLRLIEELDHVPRQYFKKLVNTDDIWEARIQVGNNTFRILGFFFESNFVVLTNGFAKKSQKTPQQEIKLSTVRKKDYLKRHKDE